MPRFECTKCGSLVVAEKGAETALCKVCGKTHRVPANAIDDRTVATLHEYDPKWNHYEKLLYQARTYRDIQVLTETAEEFDRLGDYEDSINMAAFCRSRIAEEQQKRQIETKQREIREQRRAKGGKKNRILMWLLNIGVVMILVGPTLIWNALIVPTREYDQAELLMSKGMYEDAINIFEELDDFRDSQERIDECQTLIAERSYNNAVEAMNNGNYSTAKTGFEKLDGYKDSNELMIECTYQIALNNYKDGDYDWAMRSFQNLGDYKDSAELYQLSHTAHLEQTYNKAVAAMNEERFVAAISYFYELSGYKDSDTMIMECRYQKGICYMEEEEYLWAKIEFEKILDYKDAAQLAEEAALKLEFSE